MPFDSLHAKPQSLVEVVNDLGLTPIREEELAAYKQQQLKKNRGSIWYHYRGLAVALLICCMLAGLLSILLSLPTAFFAAAHGQHLQAALYGTIALLGGSCIWVLDRTRVFSSTGRKLKGPAYWVEVSMSFSLYRAANQHTVPASINDSVFRVARALPNTHIVVGELRQDSAVIDPYLIICYGDERAIIGIWDDDGVIRQAA